MLNNIPLEMRSYAQWIAWRYEDRESAKPTKVPYCIKTGKLASVTKSETWATFDEALNVVTTTDWYEGLGFVLTDKDPYAFIDLDDTEGDKKALDRQLKIFNEFESYSERSPSGSGLHIIVKGSVPSGRRRNHIEVYSDLRYMTMTGDVFKPTPINDHNEKLNGLWAEMGEGKSAAVFYAGLEEAALTDAEVLKMAIGASNGEKFNTLFYKGDWQGQGYPSQSEADFALFDILAFYSRNGQQTQRLFLQSALGQREKSRAQYRINYMLTRCFDRMTPPVDTEGLRNQINEAIEAKVKKEKPTVKEVKETKEPALVCSSDVYSVPPGLIGDIAQFIYAQAPRQVPEIALAGALGLVSGIVGRAYNVSGTGLNQYVLLLAPTGTGKEAIASGIDKLMAAVVKTVPAAMDFVGPGEIASGQAIIKYMARGKTSFASVVGEIGPVLAEMGKINCQPHIVSLKRFLLDAFNKSGEGNSLKPSIYSNKENNTTSILSPSFTIIGESAPEPFYEGLHEGMIANGLLPRFLLIEYRGKRPYLNLEHLKAEISFDLIEKLSTLCSHCLMLNSQNKAIQVQTDQKAGKLLRDFDDFSTLNINSADREIRKHLWNRAHIKALKLAALIAVGNNPYEPIITETTAQWAIDLVSNDVKNLMGRFESGEVGIDNDEIKQLSCVIKMISAYLLSPWSDIAPFAPTASFLHSERVIPYSFLSKKLMQVSFFRKDRQGPSVAVKRALKTLVEKGDLQEISKADMTKKYSTSMLGYMVSNNKTFGL